MPYLAQQRLLFQSASIPSRCANTLNFTPSKRTLVREHTRIRQTFTSCLESSIRPHSSLRSPHQWSHIVQNIRKPAAPAGVVSMATTQVRTHGGHSHSHQHDNTFLTSRNSDDPGVRITRIGLYVNLGMAIVKGAGGIVFNSQA